VDLGADADGGSRKTGEPASMAADGTHSDWSRQSMESATVAMGDGGGGGDRRRRRRQRRPLTAPDRTGRPLGSSTDPQRLPGSKVEPNRVIFMERVDEPTGRPAPRPSIHVN
jgi:hypothetical protein